jgi:branched-chain amino acid transport system permease protein
MAYLMHVAIMAGIYAIVALGLRFATCYGGVLIVTPTVFFAAGAYSTAILATKYRWPVPLTGIASVLAAIILAALVGMLTWRLKGDYLLLASLGACEIMRSLLSNLDEVTGGAVGVMNIPNAFHVLPAAVQMPAMLVTVIAVAGACILFSTRVQASPFGKLQMSVNDDEIGASSLGHRVAQAKLLSVVWGAMWIALAGSLFASYSSYVDPASFDVDAAIFIFAMFVLGGMRSVSGTVGAASFLILLPEGLRFVGLSASLAAPTRQILAGVALWGAMMIGHRRIQRARSL